MDKKASDFFDDIPLIDDYVGLKLTLEVREAILAKNGPLMGTDVDNFKMVGGSADQHRTQLQSIFPILIYAIKPMLVRLQFPTEEDKFLFFKRYFDLLFHCSYFMKEQKQSMNTTIRMIMHCPEIVVRHDAFNLLMTIVNANCRCQEGQLLSLLYNGPAPKTKAENEKHLVLFQKLFDHQDDVIQFKQEVDYNLEVIHSIFDLLKGKFRAFELVTCEYSDRDATVINYLLSRIIEQDDFPLMNSSRKRALQFVTPMVLVRMKSADSMIRSLLHMARNDQEVVSTEDLIVIEDSKGEE